MAHTSPNGLASQRGFATVRFIALLATALASPTLAFASGDGADLGSQLPLFSVIPFAGILLSIALFPLVAPHFWHHHFPKVSAAWAIVFAVPFLLSFGGTAVHEILHIMLLDYVPFIILLWGLFTISGGVLLKGTLVGRPIMNVILLAIGTAIASFMGTTGASMLLIRPVLRANALRKSKTHVIVFFIFLVSNIGGSLTPLGDPPLFLGFLHGVPFFWTFRLLPEMLTAAALVLGGFFIYDTMLFNKEKAEFERAVAAKAEAIPMGIEGSLNFVFFAGLLGAVIFSGFVKLGQIHVAGLHLDIQNLVRDAFIIAMGLLSLKFTSTAIREGNGFTWGPIKEVAYLFAGIFVTIIPALAILKAGEHGGLGFVVAAAKEPMHFFWISGMLSSFLDNAPTYLTFFNTALGKLGLTEAQIHVFLASGAVEGGATLEALQRFEEFLVGIACGSVFMGANTYIGNAPNFMVKAIAEENEVPMPSFFGYMAWSGLVLIPTFIVLTILFFR